MDDIKYCSKCHKEYKESEAPFYCVKCGHKIDDPDLIEDDNIKEYELLAETIYNYCIKKGLTMRYVELAISIVWNRFYNNAIISKD